MCRGTERSRARPSVLDALVEPLRSLSLRQRTTTPREIDDPGPGVPQTEQPKPRSSGLPDTRRFLGYLSAYTRAAAKLISDDLTDDELVRSLHGSRFCHSEGSTRRSLVRIEVDAPPRRTLWKAEQRWSLAEDGAGRSQQVAWRSLVEARPSNLILWLEKGLTELKTVRLEPEDAERLPELSTPRPCAVTLVLEPDVLQLRWNWLRQ